MLYSNFLTLNLLKISELYFCHVLKSMRHLRNGRKQLLKFSNIANQLIRQPGVANFLDGQGNGIVCSN